MLQINSQHLAPAGATAAPTGQSGDLRGAAGRAPHQAGVGVVEPVVQGEALHQLKQGAVVKVAGVGRDELVHAVFLCSVGVCGAANQKARQGGNETGQNGGVGGEQRWTKRRDGIFPSKHSLPLPLGQRDDCRPPQRTNSINKGFIYYFF